MLYLFGHQVDGCYQHRHDPVAISEVTEISLGFTQPQSRIGSLLMAAQVYPKRGHGTRASVPLNRNLGLAHILLCERAGFVVARALRV